MKNCNKCGCGKEPHKESEEIKKYFIELDNATKSDEKK